MQLSVIIPVYNVAHYVAKCLHSLSFLAEKSVEFIFVNDGTTDESMAIIEQHRSILSNVVILHQENLGLSAARNAGLKAAKGDYIVFLDADDTLDASKLLNLLALIQEKKIALLAFRASFVNALGQEIGQMDPFPLRYEQVLTGIEALQEGYQPSSACLFIYNRSFLLEHHLFFVPNLVQEDVEFTLRLLLCAPHVYFSKELVYFYLKREGSLSNAKHQEGLKKYLYASIVVAATMKNNVATAQTLATKKAIEKNYNSVVWNLMYRLVTQPHETDMDFVKLCLQELKNKQLYPISGSLKTKFQRITTLFFNVERLFLYYIKVKIK